jgi:hypothetical protein
VIHFFDLLHSSTGPAATRWAALFLARVWHGYFWLFPLSHLQTQEICCHPEPTFLAGEGSQLQPIHHSIRKTFACPNFCSAFSIFNLLARFS